MAICWESAWTRENENFCPAYRLHSRIFCRFYKVNFIGILYWTVVVWLAQCWLLSCWRRVKQWSLWDRWRPLRRWKLYTSSFATKYRELKLCTPSNRIGLSIFYVGGLRFYRNSFYLLFSSPIPSELAERNSAQTGHMLKSKCHLKENTCPKSVVFPLEIGDPKTTFFDDFAT